MREVDVFGLDDVDIGRMLWAQNPESGGKVKLTATEDLVSDYRSWLAGDCNHIKIEVFAVKASNGALMYRKQCVICGSPDGQWIAKNKLSDAENIPEVGSDKFENYQRTRLREWKDIQANHVHRQLSNNENDYANYLRSSDWLKKRKKVLERANGLCEGCRENRATQVHHLTYLHVQNEFLWELVAVCDYCHDRTHLDEDAD